MSRDWLTLRRSGVRCCDAFLSTCCYGKQKENLVDFSKRGSGAVCSSAQIVKLNRRLQLLEEENKERSKREMILYSATVAFWLINTWIWLRR